MRVLCAFFVAAAVILPVAFVPVSPQEAVAAAKTTSLSEAEPTVLGAKKRAKEFGQPVEVGSMRGEHRQVHAQPDGSLASTTYIQPRWARKNGRWAAINTELRLEGDGTIRPVASTADIEIGNGGTGPFVRVGRAARQLSLRWPGGLPKPALEGDTVRYANVLPGVDLLVRALPDGISHTLEVKTREAAANPALDDIALITGGGLAVTEVDGGALEARDRKAGGTVLEAAQPIMWDSAGAAEPGARSAGDDDKDPAEGPGDGSRVAEIDTEVSGNRLTLRPDQNLLEGEDTEFPVYVDPQWRTKKATAWTMVSSGYPNTEYWEFKGTEGVGRCEVSKDASCRKTQTKRIMFRFPHGFYQGRQIIKAEFVAENTHSYDCQDDRSVRLWRVAKITKSTNWSNDEWTTDIAGREFSYCSRTKVEWSNGELRDHVQGAANKGYDTISFGLRAYSESSMAWWKRFTNDAWLRVYYNTPPPQPKQANLTSNPGGACKLDPPAKIGVLPEMQAKLYDPDSESAKKIYAEFGVGWDHDGDGEVSEQWRGAKVGPKTTGSLFRLKIPSSVGVPQNKLIFWKVRTWDGYEWSPWSTTGSQTGCYFIWDPEHPQPPSISSTDYPEMPDGDEEGPWHDGVGRYGKFTIDSPSADTAKYWIGLNGDPTSKYERRPSAPGGPVTVWLAPQHAGPNFVTAKAFDEVGNNSGTVTYYFRVKAGRPAKASWALDDPAGSSQVADGSGTFNATLHGGTQLGVEGMSGTAMRLNGSTGYAETGGPVVDTSKGFAIAGWVRLTSKSAYATVASQSGSRNNGAQLAYSPGADRWVFHQHTSDSGDSSGTPAVYSDQAPRLGQWTHLVGVFDGVTRQLSLYVNGRRQASTKTQETPWNATGPFQLGRAIYNGAYSAYLTGDLDDVRVFDRIVSAEEAKLMAAQHPRVAGRWKLNQVADGHTPDDGPNGFDARLYGESRIDPDEGIIGDPPGALVLDGVGDHGTALGPVLRTEESFTVAGWVTAAGRPDRPAAVFSQVGSVESGFTLRYHPDAHHGAGGYQIEIPDADKADATMQQADHSEFQADGEWDHVAIVYDAFVRQMRLYVNGQLEQLGDDVSWRNNTLPIYTVGAFEIGRSKKNTVWGDYWPGVIDDVWAFQGVATDEQIQLLATAEEFPTTPGGP